MNVNDYNMHIKFIIKCLKSREKEKIDEKRKDNANETKENMNAVAKKIVYCAVCIKIMTVL